jgi:glucan phosphoethanolaminetransferase (alkaline phosphatase superfamily)
MNSVSWKQVTGWAGIAYVVIFLVIIFGSGSGPVLADSATDIREFFEDNATSIALTTWGAALGFALFLLFASGLRSLLGPADARNEGVWSRLSFASAVATTAIGGAGSAFWAVLGQEDVLAAASDETVKTLAAFDTVIFSAILPWGMAVFLLGASVVILQSEIMAKWIGWLGLLVALLTAIGTLWPFTGDEESFLGILVFIGLFGFLIWTLGAAISMIRSDSHSVS